MAEPPPVEFRFDEEDVEPDAEVAGLDGTRLEGFVDVLLDHGSHSSDELKWQRRYCVLVPSLQKFFVLVKQEYVTPMLECHGEAGLGPFQRVDELPLPSIDYYTKAPRSPTLSGSRRKKRNSAIPSVAKQVRQFFSRLKSNQSVPSITAINEIMDGTPTLDKNVVIDLLTASIRQVHPSIFADAGGCDHLFQVVHGNTRTFYRCGHSGEQHAWLSSLQSVASQSEETRFAADIDITVGSLANVQISKSSLIQCDLRVGHFIEGKTTIVEKTGDAAIWNERLKLDGFNGAGTHVSVLVYRWSDEEALARRKRTLLGVVDVPYTQHLFVGKDTPLALENLVGQSGTASPVQGPMFVFPSVVPAAGTLSLRWSARILKVFHPSTYEPLLSYIVDHAVQFASALEMFRKQFHEPQDIDNIHVLYQSLVCILAKRGDIDEFICQLVLNEVENTPADKTFNFRNDSCASKAIEKYLVLMGQVYVVNTFGEALVKIAEDVAENGPCEIDDDLQPLDVVEVGRARVIKHVKTLWNILQGSLHTFPTRLQALFHSLRLVLAENNYGNQYMQIILNSAFFLRFLCRCIASPADIDILKTPPNRETRDCFTLVSKVLYNLIATSAFHEDDPCQYFNKFIDEERGFTERLAFHLTSEPIRRSDNADRPVHINTAEHAARLHAVLQQYTACQDNPFSPDLQDHVLHLEQYHDHNHLRERRTSSNASYGSSVPSIRAFDSVREYAESVSSDTGPRVYRRSVSAPTNGLTLAEQAQQAGRLRRPQRASDSSSDTQVANAVRRHRHPLPVMLEHVGGAEEVSSPLTQTSLALHDSIQRSMDALAQPDSPTPHVRVFGRRAVSEEGGVRDTFGVPPAHGPDHGEQQQQQQQQQQQPGQADSRSSSRRSSGQRPPPLELVPATAAATVSPAAAGADHGQGHLAFARNLSAPPPVEQLQQEPGFPRHSSSPQERTTQRPTGFDRNASLPATSSKRSSFV